MKDQFHRVVTTDHVQYLTDDEIARFLDDLDHNGDGLIDYDEVEQKLDAAHDELVPQPSHHHVLARRKEYTSDSSRDSKAPPEIDLRHEFLRSIIGSDARQIPRAEFAARVREWKIPSLELEHKAVGDYVRKMSIWRRVRAHWAVHGPEILFLVLVISMQIGFGSWQLVKYMQGPYRAAFGWGVCVAKACAGALYPTMFFLVLSMSRYFSTLLRRSYCLSRFINWDLSQSFHIKISIVALCLATLHAIGHMAGTFNHGSQPQYEQYVAAILGPDAVPHPYSKYISMLSGWTGLVALALFYILGLLSIPPVRRWNYEVFQLGHLLMYPIIALLCGHGSSGLLEIPMLGYWLLFPTLLIIIERLVRLGLSFYRISATIKVLDGETVEVTATIPSEHLSGYKPGQYVFLQVPRISFFQWHPFTVSVCAGKKVRLHIKTDGNWTRRLRTLADETGKADIEVGINGPFGAPAQRFYDFTHTIIVGSGIGVTPFSGILSDLQARDNARHGRPGRIHERSYSALSALTSELLADKSYGMGSSIASSRNEKRPFLNPSGSSSISNITTSNPNKPTRRGPLLRSFRPDYRRVDFHWTVRSRNYLLWMADLLNDVSRSQQWHRRQEQGRPHLDIRIATHVTQQGSGSSNIVTHVYCWLLEMHRTAAHPESPLTGLLNPTQFGRPDFVEILDQHYEDMLVFRASRQAERERRRDRRRRAAAAGKGRGMSTARSGDGGNYDLRIGVFYCGTPAVGEILADRCRALTARGRGDGSGIEYHFMTEVF
ncbi:FAD-binding domain-containing protein [Bombardia bombarda]|uniref:FAD-binding domain-containing protein n=1 Tax=Bombardia bombarda TaxID=252184 RepID=A0AA39X0T1_9PEZI|nr:FAD-binding domain-containing protein [Bombardia bombarda]